MRWNWRAASANSRWRPWPSTACRFRSIRPQRAAVISSRVTTFAAPWFGRRSGRRTASSAARAVASPSFGPASSPSA